MVLYQGVVDPGGVHALSELVFSVGATAVEQVF